MVVAPRARIGEAQQGVEEVMSAVDALQAAAPHAKDELALVRDRVSGVRDQLAAFTTQAGDLATDAAAREAGPVRQPSPARADSAAGFTLVEIMIVTTIIGIIAGISIPAYTSAFHAARVTRATGDIRTIDREVAVHLVLKGCYPSMLTEIQRESLRDPWGRPYEYGVIDKPSGGGGGRACAACNGSCINQDATRTDRRLVPINSDFDLFSKGKDGQSQSPLTARASWDDIVRGSNGGFIGLATLY